MSDDMIDRARATVCAQDCDDTECAMLRALLAERDDARAQLAALREAASRARANPRPEHVAALDAAIYGPDTSAAAEAHDRRVRAEALREAATKLRLTPGIRSGVDAETVLRARADEIGRVTLADALPEDLDDARVRARVLRARADEIERGAR